MIGEATQEPAFGLPALWISADDRERAETLGYTVVDPETVLITHISELVKRYAPELLTRQDVQRLLDGLAKEHPKVVEELIPHHLTLGWRAESFTKSAARRGADPRLVDDRRNPGRSCADYQRHRRADRARAPGAGAHDHLVLSQPEGLIPVMTFDPQIERMIRERHQEGLSLEPQAAQRIMTAVQRSVESFTKRGLLPVFLAGTNVRRHLRQLISHYMPQVAVLSHNEIAAGVKIQSLGIIRWSDES